MTISTVTVSISVAQITGVALANARVHFELTAADVNAGIVAPNPAMVVLASDGTGSVALWPNTLGTQATQYKVDIYNEYNALQYSGFATIPNSNCSLHNVIDLPAPGEVTTLAAGFVTVTPPPGMTSTDAQALFNELAQASTGITNLSYTASPTNGLVNSSTGTDATLPAADGTNAGLMLPAQFTKLAGVASGATVNDTDANLKARANHTGTQLAVTISDFSAAADARVSAGLAGYATTAAVAAGYQPLDSDLTAIAALGTTSYGRAFLTLADAGAGRTALGLGTAAVAATGDFDAAGAAAAAQAASQPLDSDLSAIALLATTSFGRALLTMADAAAARAAISAAALAGNTFTGDQIVSDNKITRAMLMDCGLTVGNVKGSAGGSQTFDYTAGSVGSITPNATTTISITNFPPTGNRGIMSIKVTNAGAQTINVPTTNWRNPDGTTTTTLSTYLTNAGITLQASGMNEFTWWTDDAGSTLYGVVK